MRAAFALFSANLLAIGCGGEPPVAKQPAAPPPVNQQPAEQQPAKVATLPVRRRLPTVAAEPASAENRDAAPEPAPVSPVAAPSPVAQTQGPAPPPIDEDRVAAQGIHKLSSQYLTLYTDLPLDDEIKALPGEFDQAYPQWREHLGLADAAAKAWRVVGRLMQDEVRFRAAGLLPDTLPQFAFGYTLENEIWWREQPSAYYRRHLMLHEGTHAFMYGHFGTCGPPWYMEGMAELLATHSFVDGKVTLDVFPARREDVPYWGRVKVVRDAIRDGQGLSLEQALRLQPGDSAAVSPYGWCWATAAFLDGHPRYRERFRQLPAELREPDFEARFRAAYEADWSELNEEWQCFTADLEYGYDLNRSAIAFGLGEPLASGGQKVEIAADRGWQATGIRLEAGKKYRVEASGRYQIAGEPRVWQCEPGGVTIRYYGGRPLGMLLAAVHPEPYDPAAISSFLSPIEIGLGAELTPAESGTLYLRINDSPAELADNAGSLQARVSAE